MTTEKEACTPVRLQETGFNGKCKLPHGLAATHVEKAMAEFIDFLGFVNEQLHTRNIPRLETMMMSANFSSMVGEFMAANMPKHCVTIARNTYHNGHPDIIPSGRYARNSVQYGDEGIEVKASRYSKGWQGHNPEDVFLMVFVFDANTPADAGEGVGPIPFRFKMVVSGELKKSDWRFSGRSGESRRTITASVTESGFEKMAANWIYMTDDARAEVEKVVARAERKAERKAAPKRVSRMEKKRK